MLDILLQTSFDNFLDDKLKTEESSNIFEIIWKNHKNMQNHLENSEICGFCQKLQNTCENKFLCESHTNPVSIYNGVLDVV